MIRRAILVAVFVATTGVAEAQPAPPTPVAVETPVGKFTAGGYVEASYSYNFNNPSNSITNYRGFDNRHNTFTISNAVLDGQWEKDAVSGRVMLQVGATPDTYYLGEPLHDGTSSTPSSGPTAWRFIQQVYASYKIPLGKGLTVQAGVFLSPVGMESMAVKDNWNWSRSDLFFGLPFYHTGIRATQQLTDDLAIMVMACNGWNSVVDNNAGKSVAVQLAYTDADRLLFSVLYFGGPERPTGSPEGQPWRSTFDGWVQVRPVKPLWLAANADSGFETSVFGTSWWVAGALYAQVSPIKWLYLAARGDIFREHVASNSKGTASPIFWPASWVASGTGTVDVRPRDNIMVRLEYRHDQAQARMYFEGAVRGAGTDADPFIPDTKSQDTLTLGATTWF